MSRRFTRPYAQALLASAGSDSAAQSIREELERFADAARVVPDVNRMAASPAVPLEVKESILSQVCGLLEIGALARSFLTLLMKNYRLVHLEAVLGTLDQILNRRLGIVIAEVTTAQPIDDDQRSRLEAVLNRMLRQQVDLTLRTDPKLLGGFVARVGSYRYDASVDGQLKRLATTLAQDN